MACMQRTAEPVSSDARSGERILYFLKTKGPDTAAALAARLKITPMAVRQHLYRFQGDGLVDFVDERAKVGRPSRVWRLTALASQRFPESHAELTLEMIASIRSAFGEAGMERLLRERTRRQLKDYRARMASADNSMLERARALAEIRRAQGYMAECLPRPDGSVVLAENHCPICVAASSCQGLCREELSLFRELFGKKVTVTRAEHILSGARRCAYVIAPVR